MTLKEKIDEIDNAKVDVEFTLEREKIEHDKTRKIVREKEEKIEELTAARDKALGELEQRREQH